MGGSISEVCLYSGMETTHILTRGCGNVEKRGWREGIEKVESREERMRMMAVRASPAAWSLIAWSCFASLRRRAARALSQHLGVLLLRFPPARTTGRKKVRRCRSRSVDLLPRHSSLRRRRVLKVLPAPELRSDNSRAMSSFFTLPASQKKRKREDRAGAPASKKRGVDADGDSGAKGNRKAREREQSISGSDIDEDEVSSVSGASEEESGSDSDEGETAGERRLKLAERYLENVREEVDDVGFDAAEIDRDLIAERLKEDVVRF